MKPFKYCVSAFRRNGIFMVHGPVEASNFVGNAARFGLPHEAYTTIGRWQTSKAAGLRDNEAPVRMNWLWFDIDRNDLEKAHTDAANLASRLTRILPKEAVLVSFSGSKGFHVQVSTRYMTEQVFPNSPVARNRMRLLAADLAGEIAFDPATLSPRTLIRLTGSKNDKSGLFKITYRMQEFMDTPLAEILETAKSPQPFDYREVKFVKPRRLITVPEFTAGVYGSRNVDDVFKPNKYIMAILNGIEEGQDWSDKFHGRDWAAYMLSSYVCAHPQQHAYVRELLGLEPSDDVADTLHFWNNTLCSPPMEDWVINNKIRRCAE